MLQHLTPALIHSTSPITYTYKQTCNVQCLQFVWRRQQNRGLTMLTGVWLSAPQEMSSQKTGLALCVNTVSNRMDYTGNNGDGGSQKTSAVRLDTLQRQVTSYCRTGRRAAQPFYLTRIWSWKTHGNTREGSSAAYLDHGLCMQWGSQRDIL